MNSLRKRHEIALLDSEYNIFDIRGVKTEHSSKHELVEIIWYQNHDFTYCFTEWLWQQLQRKWKSWLGGRWTQYSCTIHVPYKQSWTISWALGYMIPPSGFSWPLGAGLHNLGHILWPKLVEALDFLFCVTTELLTCVFPRRRHRSFTEKGSVSWWSWRLETILRTYVVGPQVPSISFIISCMVPHLSTRREQL